MHTSSAESIELLVNVAHLLKEEHGFILCRQSIELVDVSHLPKKEHEYILTRQSVELLVEDDAYLPSSADSPLNSTESQLNSLYMIAPTYLKRNMYTSSVKLIEFFVGDVSNLPKKEHELDTSSANSPLNTL